MMTLKLLFTRPEINNKMKILKIFSNYKSIKQTFWCPCTVQSLALDCFGQELRDFNLGYTSLFQDVDASYMMWMDKLSFMGTNDLFCGVCSDYFLKHCRSGERAKRNGIVSKAQNIDGSYNYRCSLLAIFLWLFFLYFLFPIIANGGDHPWYSIKL